MYFLRTGLWTQGIFMYWILLPERHQRTNCVLQILYYSYYLVFFRYLIECRPEMCVAFNGSRTEYLERATVEVINASLHYRSRVDNTTTCFVFELRP